MREDESPPCSYLLRSLSSAHFTHNATNEEELAIRVNDIFHVTDTLYNGQVGYWVATKLNLSSSMNKLTGAIPNKLRLVMNTSELRCIDCVLLARSNWPVLHRALINCSNPNSRRSSEN